jgi:hypothetical protein
MGPSAFDGAPVATSTSCAARGSIFRLKCARDWYLYRYQCAVQYFADNGISMPWRSGRLPITTDPLLTEDVSEMIEKPIEFVFAARSLND